MSGIGTPKRTRSSQCCQATFRKVQFIPFRQIESGGRLSKRQIKNVDILACINKLDGIRNHAQFTYPVVTWQQP